MFFFGFFKGTLIVISMVTFYGWIGFVRIHGTLMDFDGDFHGDFLWDLIGINIGV
jgi:hypothetical protein